MARKFTLLLASLLCCLVAQASIYTWSKYDLTFEVPDGGFVTYSSNTRFEIQWDEMVMTVQLYNKDKSDDKFLRENLQRKALGYNMYDLKQGKSKVKGFKALNIAGSMPDGSRAIIADLISKKQNLIVEITINYLYGNREVVDDIIKSFAENKKQQPNHEKKRQRVQTKQEADKQKKEEKKKSVTPKRDEGPLYDA
ncbi:MAG: hypothetical protein IJ775_01485 [Muribaculaceae bacterium]|nr:hypothetical protein [Muribaculaceae bacterium]